jgi:hypothetical protein
MDTSNAGMFVNTCHRYRIVQCVKLNANVLDFSIGKNRTGSVRRLRKLTIPLQLSML